MDEVRSSGPAGAWGFLSNFAAFPVAIDGRVWPTTEHYFQAQKFEDAARAERIRTTRSPAIAARLGRSRAVPIRADWEEVKDAVMLKALRHKFAQHPPLAQMLLATGRAMIVEHRARDRYWGDGGDGSGKNMLGRLLMQVRDEVRAGGGREAPSC